MQPTYPTGEQRLAKTKRYCQDLEQLALTIGATVAAAFPKVPGETIDQLTATLQRVLTYYPLDFMQMIEDGAQPQQQNEARYLMSLIEQRDSIQRQLDQFDSLLQSKAEGLREELISLFQPLFIEPLRFRLQGLNEEITASQGIVDADLNGISDNSPAPEPAAIAEQPEAEKKTMGR